MTISINGSTGITFPSGLTQSDSAGFPSGTAMLFVQTSAPTGWTKSTSHDNKALRVVSGTAGSGGSVAFTTAFASGLSDSAVTLSTSQIPSHNHLGGQPRANGFEYNGSLYGTTTSGSYAVSSQASGYYTGNFAYTSSSGGGGSHAHTLPSFAVSYVDTIIATKN